MAKAKKTKTTIQTTVDTLATAQTRSSKLRLALEKSMNVERDTRTAIMDHVRKTNGQGRVAYQAANGDTLLVHVSAFGASVDTIKPGAQSLPELPPPPTAEVAGNVAELLSKGLVAEARRLIDESLTNGNTQANTAQTATEQGVQAHKILDDIVQRKFGELSMDLGNKDFTLEAWYRFPTARLFRPQHFIRPTVPYPSRPAIEQQTYKSATMGPIKLSARAKGLLVENREAIQTAVGRGNYNAAGQGVSLSRGKIAQYMSELEQKVNDLTAKLVDATGATNA